MRTQARYQHVGEMRPPQGDVAVADTRNGGDTHGIPESVTVFLGSQTANSREVPLSCTSALNVLRSRGSSGSTRTLRVVTSAPSPRGCRGVSLDRRHRDAPGERRPATSTATGCNGGTGRSTSCPVAAGVCRCRHLRDLPRRLRDEPRTHAAWSSRASSIAGRRARLRDLPRSRPGARRRRIEGAYQTIHRSEAGGRERHLPHVPQP